MMLDSSAITLDLSIGEINRFSERFIFAQRIAQIFIQSQRKLTNEQLTTDAITESLESHGNLSDFAQQSSGVSRAALTQCNQNARTGAKRWYRDRDNSRLVTCAS